MPEVAYLSASGEIKVPLKIRTKLGLQAGEKFEVRARGQDLEFVRLGLPAVEQVREFVAWTQKHPMQNVRRLLPGTKGRAQKKPAKSKGGRRGA